MTSYRLRVGTSTPAYTVTAAQGSYSLTGQSVSLVYTPPFSGTTYYVDSSAANDSGTGSAISPKKYIQSGMVLMSASGGDQLVIIGNSVASPKQYANSLDAIANTVGRGTANAWNRVTADVLGTVEITANLDLIANVNHWLIFEGLRWKSNLSKGGSGHYFKFVSCDFIGGPLTDNTVCFAIGTNDFTPGATYFLVEGCSFSGIGGRYSCLIFNARYGVVRRNLFRHQSGWSDTKGDPQAASCNYNSPDMEWQDNYYLDTPDMLQLTCAAYNVANDSSAQTSDNVFVRSALFVNIDAAAMYWDDGKTIVNNTANNVAAAQCSAIAYVNSGNKQVTASNWTTKGNSTNFRNFNGSAVFTLNKSSSQNCLSTNVGGVTLGTGGNVNNFYNVAISGQQNTNPATSSLYPVRMEAGSTLKVAGIGAEILKKWGTEETIYGQSGYATQTSEDLWPWPRQDIILIVFKSTDSTYGVALAGNAINGSAKSLTNYAWEGFGNASPIN